MSHGSSIGVKARMLVTGVAVALVAALAGWLVWLYAPAARPPALVLAPAPPSGRAPAPGAERCAAAPHACGFPDATDTGVPAGMVLRPVPGQVSSGPGWRYDPRGWVLVYGNGAVLKGLSLSCDVNVAASGVLITDDRIRVAGNHYGISLRHTSGVTIQYSDIFGPGAARGRLMAGIKDIYGNSAGTRVLRNNIWHTSTGVQIESGLIEGNYIHAPGYLPGDHINGITSNGGVTAPLTIRHNTVFIDRNQTDAIGLFEDFGVQANRVVTGNLLAGGGYTIYAGQHRGAAATYNIRIAGNWISRLYYRNGGYYGQVTAFNPAGRGDRWLRNAWSGTAPGRPAGLIPDP